MLKLIDIVSDRCGILVLGTIETTKVKGGEVSTRMHAVLCILPATVATVETVFIAAGFPICEADCFAAHAAQQEVEAESLAGLSWPRSQYEKPRLPSMSLTKLIMFRR